MGRKRKKKKRTPLILRLRRRWTRSPVQRPHSTKKGETGSDRRRDHEAPQGLAVLAAFDHVRGDGPVGQQCGGQLGAREMGQGKRIQIETRNPNRARP